MRIIGVTGPSGSGKGKVAEILSEYGFVHIDADAVYHDLLLPPSPCLEEIKKKFGAGVICHDGTLDRYALGKIVFSPENKDKLLILNSVTHKFVCQKIRGMIKECKDSSSNCVIDAPLLIEAGLLDDCDTLTVVLADTDIRAQRIAERDNITIGDALVRINAQKANEFYTSVADCVIYNNGSADELRAQVICKLDIGGNV